MSLAYQWPLQETTGTLLVDVIGNNDGTLISGATLGDTGPNTRLPYAVSFDSTAIRPITLDSLITLASNADWSIAWWAIQDGNNFEGQVFGEGNTTNNYFWLQPTEGLRLRADDGSTYPFNGADSTARAKWSHYTIVYNGTDGTPVLSFYLDGLFNESQTGTERFDIDTIGNSYTNTDNALDGSLADLRIYDSTLNSDQVWDTFVGSRIKMLGLGQGGV